MEMKNITALVMDDDEDLLILYEIHLKKLGCTVLLADNVTTAFSLHEQSHNTRKPIHVMIIDLNMPGEIGGKEFAKQIRSIDNRVKLVVSSGLKIAPEMTHYSDHGFDAALEKNFNQQNIERVLKELLVSGI